MAGRANPGPGQSSFPKTEHGESDWIGQATHFPALPQTKPLELPIRGRLVDGQNRLFLCRPCSLAGATAESVIRYKALSPHDHCYFNQISHSDPDFSLI